MKRIANLAEKRPEWGLPRKLFEHPECKVQLVDRIPK
jgi:hypothetical protein